MLSLPPAPTRPPRILVVDDDPAQRDAYSRLLSFEGYEIVTTDNPEEVIDSVHRDPPDLILLDVDLGDACGFEVCGDLRMMDEARLTPVIIVGDDADDEHAAVRGLLCGADDFVSTPVRMEELKARVRVQLRNRRDRELLQWARQQRATFRKAAMVDPLTGIPNRRAAEEVMDDALRQAEPFTVLLVDVDHFKRVNDTLGHAVGDEVLRKVAQTLDRQARKGDMVARFGGEEFLLLIRGASATLAPQIAERFRRSIESMDLGKVSLDRVTVSIGVSTFAGGNPVPDHHTLLRVADEALYEAKGAGRNRVVIRAVDAGSTERTSDAPKSAAGEDAGEEKVA